MHQAGKVTKDFANHAVMASTNRYGRPEQERSVEININSVQRGNKRENDNKSTPRKIQRDDGSERGTNERRFQRSSRNERYLVSSNLSQRSTPVRGVKNTFQANQQKQTDRQDIQPRPIINRYGSNLRRPPLPDMRPTNESKQELFNKKQEKKPSIKTSAQNNTFLDNFIRPAQRVGRYGSTRQQVINKTHTQNRANKQIEQLNSRQKPLRSGEQLLSQTSPTNKFVSLNEQKVIKDGDKTYGQNSERNQGQGRTPVRKKNPEKETQSENNQNKLIKSQKEAITKIIIHSLGRIFRKVKVSMWNNWVEKDQFLKYKIFSIGKLFVYSMINVQKSSEIRQKKLIFLHFRNTLNQENKKVLKMQHLSKGENNLINVFPNIILKFSRQKLHEYFQKLKEKSEEKKWRIQFINSLVLFSTQKLKKQYIQELLKKVRKVNFSWQFSLFQMDHISSANCKSVKSFFLSRLSSIYLSKIETSFQKIQETPIKAIKSPEVSGSPVSKKLKQESSRFKSEEQNLKNRLEQIKEQKQYDLYQFQLKRKTNEELKYLMQSLPQADRENINIQLQEREDTKFSFLSDIFIQTLKNPSSSLHLSSIIQDIDTFEDSQITLQWKQFFRGLRLKRKIQLYEGRSERERKAAQSLNIECKVVEQIVRDYVRQRYLWEWVRNCITNE